MTTMWPVGGGEHLLHALGIRRFERAFGVESGVDGRLHGRVLAEVAVGGAAALQIHGESHHTAAAPGG
jgi:hypothetical protein